MGIDYMLGTANIDATIERWLLDVQINITYPIASTKPPAIDWWQNITFIVGCGVWSFEEAAGYPNPGPHEDPRVVVTEMLKPYYVETTGTNAARSCTWTTTGTLDSKGMRKTSIPGMVPYAATSCWIRDPHNILGTTAFQNPTVEFWAFTRALYNE